MTPNKLAQSIMQIIIAVVDDYGLTAADVTQDSSFSTDLGMDGEDVHAIICQCEKHFNIQIPDDWVTEQSHVCELIELIDDLLRDKGACEGCAAMIREAWLDFPEE